MQALTPGDWADFKAEIANAQDSWFDKPIKWLRKTSFLDRFGEDGPTKFAQIDLTCLINYNYFRSWPITNNTETGDQDRQSFQIIFTKEYLRNLNYLNVSGYFDFDPAYDRFVLDGFLCKADGDTPASQADGDDILFTLILRREEIPTGGWVIAQPPVPLNLTIEGSEQAIATESGLNITLET